MHDLTIRKATIMDGSGKARFQGSQVGFEHLVFEFAAQPALGGFHRSSVEPAEHAEGEKVFAAIDFSLSER